MDKVSRTERSMWAGPTLIFFFHVKHGACLWAGPTLFFFSRLRAGGILPTLFLEPAVRGCLRNFLKPTVLNFIIRSIQNPAQTRDHVVAHVHAATLDVNCAVVLEFIPKSL